MLRRQMLRGGTSSQMQQSAGAASRAMAIRLRASLAAGLCTCSPARVVARSSASGSSALLASLGRQPVRAAAVFFGRPAAYATDAKSDDTAGGSGGSRPNQESPKQPLASEADTDRDTEKVVMKKGGDNIQFTWATAFFTVAMCGGCLLYYQYLLGRKQDNSRAVTRHERIGVPLLGGPFELLDRKGKVKTDADLKGQYLLIYFGFTKCPDICPLEMVKQSRAIEMLDAEFGPVATPVFISVDPPRDSPAVVDEYCTEFHPRIEGLTGTSAQVKQVSRAYRVYYHEAVTQSPDDKDYLIDHSIIHYFMNKKGKFVDFFGKNMTAQEMADKMKQTICEDLEKEKARKGRLGAATDADDEE